jgi:hypothetical protein
MFYLILFILLIAAVAFVFLLSKGEGSRYGEKDYYKKKSNPFDSPMV